MAEDAGDRENAGTCPLCWGSAFANVGSLMRASVTTVQFGGIVSNLSPRKHQAQVQPSVDLDEPFFAQEVTA